MAAARHMPSYRSGVLRCDLASLIRRSELKFSARLTLEVCFHFGLGFERQGKLAVRTIVDSFRHL
jgi:hypothetical protein